MFHNDISHRRYRGGVEIAAIFLLNDNAHRFASLFLNSSRNTTVAPSLSTASLWLSGPPRYPAALGCRDFHHDVIAGQRHVQTIVGDLVLRMVMSTSLRHISRKYSSPLCSLPRSYVHARQTLHLHRNAFCIAVETFKVSQLHFTGVFLLCFSSHAISIPN